MFIFHQERKKRILWLKISEKKTSWIAKVKKAQDGCLVEWVSIVEFMCSEIDYKSDWCSGEPRKNALSEHRVLDLCGATASTRYLACGWVYKIIIYLLFFYIVMMNHGEHHCYFSSSIGSYRLNWIVCFALALLVDRDIFSPCGISRRLRDGKLKSIGKCNWNVLRTLIKNVQLLPLP